MYNSSSGNKDSTINPAPPTNYFGFGNMTFPAPPPYPPVTHPPLPYTAMPVMPTQFPPSASVPPGPPGLNYAPPQMATIPTQVTSVPPHVSSPRSPRAHLRTNQRMATGFENGVIPNQTIPTLSQGNVQQEDTHLVRTPKPLPSPFHVTPATTPNIKGLSAPNTPSNIGGASGSSRRDRLSHSESPLALDLTPATRSVLKPVSTPHPFSPRHPKPPNEVLSSIRPHVTPNSTPPATPINTTRNPIDPTVGSRSVTPMISQASRQATPFPNGIPLASGNTPTPESNTPKPLGSQTPRPNPSTPVANLPLPRGLTPRTPQLPQTPLVAQTVPMRSPAGVPVNIVKTPSGSTVIIESVDTPLENYIGSPSKRFDPQNSPIPLGTPVKTPHFSSGTPAGVPVYPASPVPSGTHPATPNHQVPPVHYTPPGIPQTPQQPGYVYPYPPPPYGYAFPPQYNYPPQPGYAYPPYPPGPPGPPTPTHSGYVYPPPGYSYPPQPPGPPSGHPGYVYPQPPPGPPEKIAYIEGDLIKKPGKPIPDYSKYPAEEQARRWAEVTALFRIIHKKHPELGVVMPNPEKETLAEAHARYNQVVDNVYKNRFVSEKSFEYRMYIILFWVVIEIVMIYVLKLPGGYTTLQLRMMKSYDVLLIQLGEDKWEESGGGKPKDPLMSMLFISVVTALIFGAVRFFAKGLSENAAIKITDVIYNTTLGDGVFNGGAGGGEGGGMGGLADVRGIDDVVKLFKNNFAGEGGGLNDMISNVMGMFGDGGENPTGPKFEQ